MTKTKTPATTTSGKRGTRPPTIPFVDEGGRECLRVPLDPHGRTYAVTLKRDYEMVRQAGATGPWYLNGNGQGQTYVRTKVPHERHGFTSLIVARIIAGAGAKSTIYNVNKDRLDLRPENLFWHRDGRAKIDAIKAVQVGAAIRAAREEARTAVEG